MSWFRRRPKPEDTQRPSTDDIVRTYGATLENAKVGMAGTMDEADLPYDKALIKDAIFSASSSDDVSEEMMGAFGTAFVQLANFQPGGGEPGSAFYGKDLPNDRAGIEAYAKVVLEVGPREQKLADAALAEMTVLASEWDAHVLAVKANKNA